MKSGLILAVFMAICISVNCARGKPGNPGYCTPDEMFSDGCNSCWCNENGTNAICTKKACVTLDLPKPKDGIDKIDSITPADASLPEAECTPGDSKKLDCNDCFCTETKLWACTEKGCPSFVVYVTPESKPAADPVNPDAECTPGDKKMLDCNRCFCTDKGFWGCTLIGCPSQNTHFIGGKPDEVKRSRRNLRRKRGECTPGETKMQDCNRCFCSKGGFWACTLKGCISDPGNVHHIGS